MNPIERGHIKEMLLEPMKEFGHLWHDIFSPTYAPWATKGWEKAMDIACRVIFVASGTLLVATLFSLIPAAVGVSLNSTKDLSKASSIELQPSVEFIPEKYFKLTLVTSPWGINRPSWVVNRTELNKDYPENPSGPYEFPIPGTTLGEIAKKREILIAACEAECVRRNNPILIEFL